MSSRNPRSDVPSSGSRRYSSQRPTHPNQTTSPPGRPTAGYRSDSDTERRQRRRSSAAGGHRETSVQRPQATATRRTSGTTSDKPKPTEPQYRVRQVPSPGNSLMPSPYSPDDRDRDPMLEAGVAGQGLDRDLSRKKSLVRPERRRNDPEDPNYYYRKHAQKMNVLPSTTGTDPQMEEELLTLTTDSAALHGQGEVLDTSPLNEKPTNKDGARRQPAKLTRRTTANIHDKQVKDKRRQEKMEDSGALTLWGAYCHVLTFWCPNFILSLMGKKSKEQQRAWREKIGLCSIILLMMLFVGYLTFGFTATVCPEGGPLRLRINNVDRGYMIFHGQAYDLTRSQHPLARGVPAGSNVLFDGTNPGAGMDGSFLMQNVNGACKGLITPSQNSDVPVDSKGNMAWYFPCNLFKQDGSTPPNTTIPYYLGYACHTSRTAREAFYGGLRSSGDVYFTWEDIRNTSRNLVVYSGDVLDLDLLRWFNASQVAVPPEFEQIRTNSVLRGKDITLAYTASDKKQIAQCFQEIIKVGSIDTESVGCIASKVVLYVSLIFILGIVGIKFVLACLFQWFLCRKYAADKTSMPSDKKARNRQIEDWSDDIYRPPPKITDPVASSGGSDRGSKRGTFMPTTSRFTSPYAMDKGASKTMPTTMTSQTNSRLMVPAGVSGIYGHSNRSDGSLDGSRPGAASHASLMDSHNFPASRYSSVMTDGNGPQGFIHDAVVPQPPPEWQPFGFPLAHTICLVTAYSEGLEGIRTTLDSIAMTDYPNSHKMLYVVCDGLIKGKGETMSTPDACISMMKEFAVLPDDVQPYSYVAVASGSKRHNMAKVYCGFYDYGVDSIIPVEKQQRVPMVLIVKCGTPAEATASKPGNRGKRDSQIVLMSFLQKVMFDERMTELEYEMFNGIWKITGISPDFYEIVLMVDADTKVFPDSLTHMVSAMVKDPEIMGLCGETKIANKTQSWVSMIQVFEYFISHHQAKSFESVFGGVTCLPGCFCMYRIKTPKGGQNYWVPILANPDIVEHYSENVVDTLHKKNLLLLGEDRYLSSLMLKTFPKRKQVFVPQAVCKTTVPDEFKVLLSQRRRWINSTVHNLMELVLVRDLCGTFCFSMQFVVFIDLVGTVVLPAAIAFTLYVLALALKAAATNTPAPVIPLVLLALILGLPGVLIVITAHRVSYVLWMFVYLLSLPVWNFILPCYAFWHFDDFSWGDTRQAAGEVRGADKSGHGGDGAFDSSKITMKRWGDFEQERRLRQGDWTPPPMPFGAAHYARPGPESPAGSVVGGGGAGAAHGYDSRTSSPQMMDRVERKPSAYIL